MGPRLTMREQIIIRISLRDDVPLRWPSCEDYSAPWPLPSKQRVAGSSPAGRARQNPRSAVVLSGRVVALTRLAQGAVPVACPMTGVVPLPARPLPSCSARRRWPAGARRCRAGRSGSPAPRRGPSGPSARAGWRPRSPRGRSPCAVGLRLPSSGTMWLHVTVAALFANTIPYTLFAIGEQHVSSSVAGVLNATTPLWALVIAFATGHERRISAPKLIGRHHLHVTTHRVPASAVALVNVWTPAAAEPRSAGRRRSGR